jgi:tetratricopeptide (TPR) repeat protein
MLERMGLIVAYPVAATLFIFLFERDANADESPAELRVDFHKATKCYNRGVALLGRKDYDRAIVDFAEAIRYNPKYVGN